MAFQVKKGTLTVPAATGNQAITGVGFTPKALILFGTGQTAAGIVADLGVAIGVSSALASRSASAASQDAVATTTTSGRFNSTAFNKISPAAVVSEEATLVSFDADGFTLNWSVVTSGAIVHYLALGGADLTNVFVGDFAGNGLTGNQGVTGVGFTPDIVIPFGVSGTGVLPQASGGGNGDFNIGAAQSSIKRWAEALESEGGLMMATATMAQKTQRTDSCILEIVSGVVGGRADFVSMDADGFTVNWIAASSNTWGFLALKGGQYDVNAFNSPAGTGSQSITLPGFRPTGLLLEGWDAAASTALTGNADGSLGATDGTAVGTAAGHQTTNSLNTVAKRNENTTNVEETITTVASRAANFTSFDATGFTLNWATNPSAAQFAYVAFGSAVVVQAPLNNWPWQWWRQRAFQLKRRMYRSFRRVWFKERQPGGNLYWWFPPAVQVPLNPVFHYTRHRTDRIDQWRKSDRWRLSWHRRFGAFPATTGADQTPPQIQQWKQRFQRDLWRRLKIRRDWRRPLRRFDWMLQFSTDQIFAFFSTWKQRFQRDLGRHLKTRRDWRRPLRRFDWILQFSTDQIAPFVSKFVAGVTHRKRRSVEKIARRRPFRRFDWILQFSVDQVRPVVYFWHYLKRRADKDVARGRTWARGWSARKVHQKVEGGNLFWWIPPVVQAPLVQSWHYVRRRADRLDQWRKSDRWRLSWRKPFRRPDWLLQFSVDQVFPKFALFRRTRKRAIRERRARLWRPNVGWLQQYLQLIPLFRTWAMWTHRKRPVRERRSRLYRPVIGWVQQFSADQVFPAFRRWAEWTHRKRRVVGRPTRILRIRAVDWQQAFGVILNPFVPILKHAKRRIRMARDRRFQRRAEAWLQDYTVDQIPPQVATFETGWAHAKRRVRERRARLYRLTVGWIQQFSTDQVFPMFRRWAEWTHRKRRLSLRRARLWRLQIGWLQQFTTDQVFPFFASRLGRPRKLRPGRRPKVRRTWWAGTPTALLATIATAVLGLITVVRDAFTRPDAKNPALKRTDLGTDAAKRTDATKDKGVS